MIPQILPTADPNARLHPLNSYARFRRLLHPGLELDPAEIEAGQVCVGFGPVGRGVGRHPGAHAGRPDGGGLKDAVGAQRPCLFRRFLI